MKRKVAFVGACLGLVCFFAHGSDRVGGSFPEKREMEGQGEPSSHLVNVGLGAVDKEVECSAKSTGEKEVGESSARKSKKVGARARIWDFASNEGHNKQDLKKNVDKEGCSAFKRGSETEKLWKCVSSLVSSTQSAIFEKIEDSKNSLLQEVGNVRTNSSDVSSLRAELIKAQKENAALRDAAANLCDLYRSRGIYLKGSERFFQELGVTGVEAEEFDYADCVESIVGRAARVLVEIKAVRIRRSVDGRGLVRDLQDYKCGVLSISGSDNFQASLVNDIDVMTANYQGDETDPVSVGTKGRSCKTPAKKRGKSNQEVDSASEEVKLEVKSEE